MAVKSALGHPGMPPAGSRHRVPASRFQLPTATKQAHYVRERMRAGDLHYTYVSTNENIADCMTKNNYYPAFKKFRAAMGVA